MNGWTALGCAGVVALVLAGCASPSSSGSGGSSASFQGVALNHVKFDDTTYPVATSYYSGLNSAGSGLYFINTTLLANTIDTNSNGSIAGGNGLVLILEFHTASQTTINGTFTNKTSDSSPGVAQISVDVYHNGDYAPVDSLTSDAGTQVTINLEGSTLKMQGTVVFGSHQLIINFEGPTTNPNA